MKPDRRALTWALRLGTVAVVVAVVSWGAGQVDFGKVWHALLVRSPGGNETATQTDTIAARQFQQAALTAFAQDFEVWTNKGPCLNGLFIPSDGPFMKARIWYKQFYNPRAMKQEFLDQCEGYYVPKGAVPYTDKEEVAA